MIYILEINFNTSLKKLLKQFILVVALLWCTLYVFAQQTPHYTQYLYNMQVINPAYVASRSDLSISILSREQWVGIEGAPKTKTFSLSGRTYDGIGLGFTVINDQLGLAEINNANIDISYTILTSNYGRLAFGLKGGMSFFSNNLSEGITPDSEINSSVNGQSPNVGFGAYYYTQRFFMGLSVPYFLETSIFRTANSQNNTGVNKNLNYFFTTGGIFKISEDLLFKPSTLVKYATNLPVSIDANANLLYKNTFETGLSYRYEDSINFLFALIINKKIRVGYTYDYKVGDFGNQLNTHEILLHIDLNFKRNTRWLEPNRCYF